MLESTLNTQKRTIKLLNCRVWAVGKKKKLKEHMYVHLKFKKGRDLKSINPQTSFDQLEGLVTRGC